MFLIILEKRETRKLAGQLRVFHLRFGKTGGKKRATCFAFCPKTRYKEMLRVLPPTDKNLSFFWPFSSPFAAMLQKKLHVFVAPHRSLKEKQTNQNNKNARLQEDWKDVFGIQHGCYEHRF